MLFCGDSLFSCGCGRLREGSPAQLLRVMHTFSALEPATVVYCTHEYTLDNIEFALSVEPDNLDLHAWKTRALALRTDGAPTLPTTIAHELAVNPFLRTRVESVKAGVARYLGVPVSSLSELDVMTALRRWKDVFKSAPTPSAAPSHSRSQ